MAVLLAGAAMPVLLADPASAQSVFPGAHDASQPGVMVDELVVVREGRQREQVAQARAHSTPGGASVVAQADIAGQANVTLSDALTSAPGVVVQNFFGANDQPRLQIRGSGLQQNPVERGVLFMQDGLPLNRADGSYVVGLVDPRQAAFIEVFRGYTANRLGATVLGGAINFVLTPDRADEQQLQVEAGSFGHVYGAGRVGFAGEVWDGAAGVSRTERDGFREYNSSERTSVYGTVTHRWIEGISTQLSAGHVESRFDVAGPLTRAALEADPSQVFRGPTVVGGVAQNPGPNVVRDLPRRDTTLSWVGSRTTAALDGHVFDIAMGYVWSDDSFRFPISAGERVTDGGDINVMVRYAVEGEGGALPLLEVTSHWSSGSAKREYYLNAAGVRGALFGAGDLDATTYGVNVNANLPVSSGVFVSPSLSYARAERSFVDTYDKPTRPTLAFSPVSPSTRLPDGAVATTDASYDRSYDAVSAALAVSWAPREDDFVYAAVSQSFEPPSHDDLIAAINGTPNSSAGRPNPGAPAQPAVVFATPALKAQRGTTLEAGWRGVRGGVRFDALAYYGWLENELLNLRDATGASLGAINADKTRHLGVELGVSAALTEQLSGRLSYLYQDFRFHDDPVRGDNKLAGAPPHVVELDLSYAATPAFTVGLGAHWRPVKMPVDNMNTLYNAPFVTLDARAVYSSPAGWSAFVEARNLADETYAGSTLVVDQARSDQAAYIPGDGRAVYAGLRLRY